MKVSFENGVGTYSGKYDEVVYQAWYNGTLCLARKYAYPTLSQIHEDMREIGENLNNVYLAADERYIADFKAYAARNTKEHRPRAKRLLSMMPTSKSLFVKCMWLWKKSDPEHVDLKTVTVADIVTLASPLFTVADCVREGYLKRVSGWELLNHEIVGEP